MKSIIQFLLFISLTTGSSAQIISIEKIKAVPQNEFNNTTDSTLVFPVFKLKNKSAENKINQKLKNDFKKERDIDKKENNIRSMLSTASKEGLTDLDFEVIYQTKKLISFNFQWGGMGAYPTTWQTYYCFNLETGNLITLDSLIDRTHRTVFLNLVKKKRSAKINSYIKELSGQLRKKEVDKETYDWALNNIKNNCWDNYNSQKFIIDKKTLTIIIDCNFPHAIQALSPDNDIKLPVDQIAPYLNKKYNYILN